MCYDISFTVSLPELADYFPDLVIEDQLDAGFDGTHIIGHAYGYHPILYKPRGTEQVHCKLMEWGCIPYYIKDEKSYLRQRAGMLNARSERILEDEKSYWFKIKNRRCLIPATGLYEHRAIRGWKNKVPYFVRLKHQRVFLIPGLYSVAELPDTSTGEMIKRFTYTLITRNANDVMMKIHNSGDTKGRMPLLLPHDMAVNWLANNLTDSQYKDILNFEMPSDELDFHPVFTIRSPKLRPDNQPKNAYWEWEKLPELGTMAPDL
jgi:putative SOS response-associated peptidase YedK